MPEHDLDLLKDAALAAGDIARRHFRGSFETRDKGDGQGPVTEVDLEIDRMLKAELTSSRPAYGWLSEESEDDRQRLEREAVFIVDPIDGTRSFVNGNKTFAHSLAIARNGIVTAAVVHLPMLERTFVASAGNGAFLNRVRITSSQKPDIEKADILAAKPQLDPGLWPRGVPNVTRQFRSSLAYRLCLVGQGRFDGMVTLRDAWEWDIAAGELICREAGAVCTDRLGERLVFNNRAAKTLGVLAACPGVHRGLLGHLLG